MPAGSRASRDSSLFPEWLGEDNLAKIRSLNEFDVPPDELAEIDRYATDAGINL